MTVESTLDVSKGGDIDCLTVALFAEAGDNFEVFASVNKSDLTEACVAAERGFGDENTRGLLWGRMKMLTNLVCILSW